MADTQESVDSFYWQKGPCCAGCDWWRHHNAVVGECVRSAPVGSEERWSMTGIYGSSLAAQAGHVMTNRSHYCGEFKDSFDWRSLPVSYQARVGFQP